MAVGYWQIRSSGNSGQKLLKLAALEEEDTDVTTLASKIPDVHEVQEVPDRVFRDVVVQSVTPDGLGGKFQIRIPEDGTVGLVRELVAGRCGGGGVAAHIRMVRRFTDVLFLPMDDSEPSTDEVLLLGIDLDGVEADAIDSTSDPVEGAHVGAEASEAIHAHADVSDVTRESIALLTAAMELLEAPQVQELFIGQWSCLDTSVSEILAAWEPPWISEGFDDLDAETLKTVEASTIQAWAKSFSRLVAEMSSANEKFAMGMDAEVHQKIEGQKEDHSALNLADEARGDNDKIDVAMPLHDNMKQHEALQSGFR